MVKAEPGTGSTSKDNNCNLTLLDDIITNLLLFFGHIFSIDDEVLLNSFKICLGIVSLSSALNYEILIQLIGCKRVNTHELIQQIFSVL